MWGIAMNRYDDKYIFRLATVDDVDDIMGFIGCEWNKDHILAHDKELFLWQYGRSEYRDFENINVMLITDKQNEILGMIGFIAYSEDKSRFDIAPAMTKVRGDGLLPMTGIEFMKRQMKVVGERHHISSGTNPKTIKPLYERVFKFRVGIMQQYYMLNDEMEYYNIAKIEKKEFITPKQTGYKLNEINSLEDVEKEFDLSADYQHVPYKSKEYLTKRYFEHPIYKYKKWSIESNKGDVVGLLFGREILLNGSKVLRLVDFRGDIEHIYELGEPISMIMYQGQYEYVDLMVDLLDCSKMRDNGFMLLDYEDVNIIPNYFEPFVRENIKNHFENDGDCVIFKADGDQDRPNYR